MEDKDIRSQRAIIAADSTERSEGFETVYTNRIWTRDADDLIGGTMSSMHSFVKLNKEEGQLRAEISLRDCHNQIAYVHWVEGKQAHVDKAVKSLHKIRDMLDEYIVEFEEACEKLEDLK